MTYREAENLLKNIRHYKAVIAGIKEQIAEIRNNLGWLTPMPGRAYTPSSLKVLEDYEGVQEILAGQMLEIKGKEALISEAIDALPEEQKRVVKEYFFRSKTIKEIAIKTPCDRTTVFRQKRKAIHNIAVYITKREGLF